jgi:thioredoxin 2
MKNDLHLVCPHCQSINRVPTAKLSEHPNCGRCQQPLFTGEPIELTTATFSRHVERSDCRCWSISGHLGAGRAR